MTIDICMGSARWNKGVSSGVNVLVKARVTAHPGWPRTVPVYTYCHGLIINSASFTVENALVWMASFWSSS